MRENVLKLDNNLKIKDIEADIDFYKGYIDEKYLRLFISSNRLDNVTIETVNSGVYAFYDDKENYRVFCLPILGSNSICVYVVPFPPNDENGSDERISVVENLMSRIEKIKEYYKMMKYGF